MREPIYVDVEQGTYEWEQCRLGIPTGSRYDDLLTPKQLKLSASSRKYRNHLLAEWLAGYPVVENNASGFMDRGEELEPEARRYYAFAHDVEVREIGFVFRADRKTGCSPDGLVGDDGGLEIKTPALTTMIDYMETPSLLAGRYRGQTQGALYLTGRAWWDILAYSPILPPVVVRVEPDPAYSEALHTALGQFLDDLDDAKRRLADYRQPRVRGGGLSPLPGDEPTFLEQLLRESLEAA